MKVFCQECEAQMVDGLMKHKKGCSAILFEPKIYRGIQPPSTVIKFDSKEEQKKFMDNISKGSGFTVEANMKGQDND